MPTVRVVAIPALVISSLLGALPSGTSAQAKAADRPPSARCDGEGFAPDFPLVLRAGVPALVYHTAGAWTCGAFKEGPRWVRSAELRAVPVDTTTRPAAWVGRWMLDEGTATIRRGKGDTFLIDGHAWRLGRPGVSHSGRVKALAVPSGSRLHFVDEQCVLDLALDGKYIVAGDNNSCGGLNVRFWGIWKRSVAGSR